MKIRPLHILWIWLFIMPQLGYSQKEAVNWSFGNGYGLNFNTGKAVLQAMAPQTGGATETYSDVAGQVMLYANENGVFNRKGELIRNDTWNAVGSIYMYIVPKPGTNTQFYVFYQGYRGNIFSVYYVIIDITGNNGKGSVAQPDKILYEDTHGSFTVTGTCNDTYWVVGEADRNGVEGSNTDKIFAYKITRAGIAPNPVISTPVPIGNSGGYTFSPTGNRIVFNYGGLGDQGFALARFNTQTGEVSDVIKLGSQVRTASFSASGTKLYFNLQNGLDPQVFQFDLSSDRNEDILNSIKEVYKGPGLMFDSRLAPDGKIYFTDQKNNKVLGVINYPEKSAEECEYLPGSIALPQNISVFLPNAISSFLYADPRKPDAGPEGQVCVGQPTTLGANPVSGFTYRWEPANHLSDASVSNPVFKFTTDTLTRPLRLTYSLYVKDGSCERKANVMVTVNPLPQKKITGSQSVCPGVEQVAYSVSPDPGYHYLWTVSGGNIVSGQGTAAIKVNWGKSNPAAQVKVLVTTWYGCSSPEFMLPVRINVELKPPTPLGPNVTCLNQIKDNSYSVTYTNGSVYTWGIKGGIIQSGQGTSQVKVDWQGLGTHKLWIQEQSTTQDTICFGVSDTLRVTVFQDQTALVIRNVSTSLDNERKIEVTWASSDISRVSDPLRLSRKKLNPNTVLPALNLNPQLTVVADFQFNTDDSSIEYEITALNGCNEPIKSAPHRTILLQGEAGTGDTGISLSWNSYIGWPDGVERYEIWRQLDNEPAMVLIASVNKDLNHFTGLKAGAGFAHHYRVKAISGNNAFVSWSNGIDFTFDHQLIVPNIFTPNGDNINDTFSIKLLELFPENEIIIYNRWGQPVYKTSGYKNNWTAAGVKDGTYYYTLTLNKTGKQLKGWVEIVR